MNEQAKAGAAFLVLAWAAAAPAARAAEVESGIVWVTLPGGTFTMGSPKNDGEAPTVAENYGKGIVETDSPNAVEGPPHRVTVKSFQISRSPVTNKQYRKCVEAGACTPAHVSDGTCRIYTGVTVDQYSWALGKLPEEFLGDDQPVVCVDWEQARAFSAWVGGRLPSEAEWEYAATSGGTAGKYPWGDDPPSCERTAMRGCGNVTAPVCSRPAGNTRQGLCDMAGNVWEWVEDRFHASYVGAPTDGSAWEDTNAPRVVRGGSWRCPAERRARSRSRRYVLGDRYAALGFRSVR